MRSRGQTGVVTDHCEFGRFFRIVGAQVAARSDAIDRIRKIDVGTCSGLLVALGAVLRVFVGLDKYRAPKFLFGREHAASR